MIKPGTYKLTQDVKNPRPDKRKTSDWTARQKFDAGDVFIVIAGGSDGVATMKCCGESQYDKFAVHDPRALAMEPFLEPIEETIEAMFLRLGLYSWSLPRFCQYLIESGTFTKDEFEKHMTTWLNFPSRES